MRLRILIVDDEEAARYGMTKALAKLDAECTEAEGAAAALEAFDRIAPDLVFLDLDMPDGDGREVLQQVRERQQRSCEVIVVTADDAVQSAVDCIRLGATDYVQKPFEIERLRAIVRRNIERCGLERRVDELQSNTTSFGQLIGVSAAMRELFEKIPKAAAAPLDVLIRGETGTGKELVAREVHRCSERRDGPFVAVNAAAIHSSLAESHLFGHKKGAFTGATSDHRGVFEQAHGGTLFLDEIGDMPAELQVKLLRVLQERQVTPVGGTTAIDVDVRVVSATHQELQDAIAEGHFREDLFYRLKGIELRVPPLRARHEDILALAEHFLRRVAADRRLAPGARRRLLAHHWPGNVRELEQAIRAAGAMAAGSEVEADEIALDAREAPDQAPFAELFDLPLTEAKQRLGDWFERVAIQRALDAHDGNISAAARQLGIHRQSLQQKLRRSR